MTKKLIFGVGFNSRGIQVKFGKKSDPSYEAWRGMLRRCYSEDSLIKCPTYRGCSVTEEWFDYCNFYGWRTSLEYIESGWQLDKDLLIKGNKVYSKDRCVYLPRQINVLLTKRKAKRGEYPIGVHYNHRDDLFQVSCNDYNGKMWHSYCKDPETAFLRYKDKKEEVMRYWADFYKDCIDPRAYEALYNYQVCIDD